MKYANALIAHIRLQVADAKAAAAFDLRLRRIEAREARRVVRHGVFKNQSTPQAA